MGLSLSVESPLEFGLLLRVVQVPSRPDRPISVIPTGLSWWKPYAATDEAYTNRRAPALAAARNAFSVPSTLMARVSSREALPVIRNAKWTTTLAPAKAS